MWRMGGLPDVACHAEACASLAFRERIYRRGEQGELLRDVISLANSPVLGPRLLLMGVADSPEGRRFPGVSARSWRSFCDALREFLGRAVEPALQFQLETFAVDDARIGVLRLDPCDDPPYLLARRISASRPAGGGWIRR